MFLLCFLIAARLFHSRRGTSLSVPRVMSHWRDYGDEYEASLVSIDDLKTKKKKREDNYSVLCNVLITLAKTQDLEWMEPPAWPWWLIYFCFHEGKKSYCDCIVLWQQLAHNLPRLCRIKGEPSCCLKSLWSKVTLHLFFSFFISAATECCHRASWKADALMRGMSDAISRVVWQRAPFNSDWQGID